MPEIPDLNDTELWVASTALEERYGREVDLQVADAEIRLSPSDRELASCPVFYWEAEGCHFVIFKTGDSRYRCQFFYKPYRQMSTGVHEYDNLSECIVSLLQVQADYVAREKGDIPRR